MQKEKQTTIREVLESGENIPLGQKLGFYSEMLSRIECDKLETLQEIAELLKGLKVAVEATADGLYDWIQTYTENSGRH